MTDRTTPSTRDDARGNRDDTRTGRDERSNRNGSRTDRTGERAAGAGSRRRMGEISHTNPYTGESTGQLFSRGPTVAADGGRPLGLEAPRRTDRGRPAGEGATMRTVSHSPPRGADGANRAFERGGER